MQKINIKKVTKEQMAKMLETAYEANENANVELERTATQIHAQQEEIAALRAKLEETERALEETSTALKLRTEECDKLREKLNDAETALGRANAEAASAKSEGRTLADQLGKRTVELSAAKKDIGELQERLAAAEAANEKKNELLDGAISRLKAERSVKESYHEAWKWCMAHPWRNLWRCMKENFHK